MDGRLRAEDRRPAARDPAQRQPLRRPDVRRRHADHEEAARPRLRAAPHALGADLRSHPDRRATARRTRCSRRATSSPTSKPGTRAASAPTVHTPDMLPREYAREAFKRGLKYEQKLGANPFKFGMIGSTDSHTGALDHARRTTSSARWRRWSLPRGPSASTRSSPAASQDPKRNGNTRGRAAPPGSRRSGRRTTRAKRCGTRWRARRSTRPPARG